MRRDRTPYVHRSIMLALAEATNQELLEEANRRYRIVAARVESPPRHGKTQHFLDNVLLPEMTTEALARQLEQIRAMSHPISELAKGGDCMARGLSDLRTLLTAWFRLEVRGAELANGTPGFRILSRVGPKKLKELVRLADVRGAGVSYREFPGEGLALFVELENYADEEEDH
jgi:hypothetical protein